MQMWYTLSSVPASILVILLLTCLSLGQNSTYQQKQAVFKAIFGSRDYGTEIRPILNQNDVITVQVTFEIVSIIHLDEVSQNFIVYGFLMFLWKDETISWDPAKYGGIAVIHPTNTRLWRPMVSMLNKADNEEMFKGDNIPLIVFSDGNVGWNPSNHFEVICDLDMARYPFDKHTCSILMMNMGYTTKELQYVVDEDEGGILDNFYLENNEWDLTGATASIINSTIGSADNETDKLSTIKLSFYIERRPVFLLLNIVLPIVLLSFLNLLVFLIPVDSGDKIGYGITVLLALTVYLGLVGDHMPQTTDHMPIITVYLFVLLVISVLTVVDSIIIVYYYHKEEKEETQGNSQNRYLVATPNMTMHDPRARVLPPTQGKSSGAGNASRALPEPPSENGEEFTDFRRREDATTTGDKYKSLSKTIDRVSFVVFFIVWLACTAGFLIYISTE